LLGKIKKMYRAGDDNSLQKIASLKLVSKAAGLLDQISGKESQLLEKDKAAFKKNIRGKLQSAIDGFIPVGIRLAKYPTIQSEQESALKILSIKQEKIAAAAKRYETELLGKISADPLEQCFTLKELTQLQKRITALFNNPKTSAEGIVAALEGKDISQSNAKKYEDLKEWLVKNEQLPHLKNDVDNQPDLNAINNTITEWSTQVAQPQQEIDALEAVKQTVTNNIEEPLQAYRQRLRTNQQPIAHAEVQPLIRICQHGHSLKNQITALNLTPAQKNQLQDDRRNLKRELEHNNLTAPVPATAVPDQMLQLGVVFQRIRTLKQHLAENISRIKKPTVPQAWTTEITNKIQAASGVGNPGAALTQDQRTKIKTELGKQIIDLKKQVAIYKKIAQAFEQM